METIEKMLLAHTAPGDLYETLPDKAVRCTACGHRCKIRDGMSGVCKVRKNQGGTLHVPMGYVAGLQCDPIEKKPFYHALPGELTLSFGMLGCDYHCPFCQNWLSSQVLRDPNATAEFREISAREIVDIALRQGARAVTSTYNEPLITSEWAVEVFKLAKQHGLYTSFVSNGNATQEVIDYIQPFTDFYKIDLKSFQDANYRKLGGTLKTVLDTIQRVYDNHFWLELVTLIVPTLNDSEEELRDLAQFIASISVDIPWHVTAFYETYKMHGPGGTPLRTLLRAAEIGNEEGLRFVYIGNVRGSAPQWENTYCPNCHELVIERHGYHIQQNTIQDGKCQACGYSIPGVWH